MNKNSVSRVNYFDKQFLRVDEFRDEQLYQLALRRRHNITLHRWGIVSGLELASEDGATVVKPGIAIDGYGRELVLETKNTLATETFDVLATDRLDVWLVYNRSDASRSPAGYGECGVSTGNAYRITESPLVLFEKPLMNNIDARRPPGVPAEVLNAPVPYTSDDPHDIWRVYLGRITRLPDKITLDMSGRPYVGIVAETIDHPSNPARVEIGRSSPVKSERSVGGVVYSYDPPATNSPRFAVFVPLDVPGPSMANLTPRLEINSDGTIQLRGQTVVSGNLRISGGAVRFMQPADFTADNAPAKPSIYSFSDNGKEQLRIDLGLADSEKRQFAIGFSTPDGKFTECLRIDLQDTTGTNELVPVVTVSGDLKVAGKVIGEFVPPALSPDAMAAILGSFQSGLAAGNS